MKKLSPPRVLGLVLVVLLGSALAACDTEDATTAVVVNAYSSEQTQPNVVYRVWWQTTYFPDAVVPGATSNEERSVPGTRTAYALLAPGWDPTSGAPPKTLVVVQSRNPFEIHRGDQLQIQVDDDHFRGSCRAGSFLSQAEADFITGDIFAGDFAGATYDPATCITTLSGDAGAP
jgi:hypothetical protein